MARAVTTTRRTILVRQWLDWLRDAFGGRLLWALILAFGLWALFAHTDQFVVGVIVGSVYILGALGLTLIFGVFKFPHFAHGDWMMFSAYLTFFVLSGAVVGTQAGDVVFPLRIGQLPGATTEIWRFSFGYGLILAIILAAVIATPLFLLIDRLVYRPFRERGAGVAIYAIASLGIAIALRGLMLMIWGSTPRNYTTGIRETVQIPGGPRIVADQLFIILAAAVFAAMTYYLLYRTRTGKAMRAMADNADLARVSGIDTEAISRWTWVISGGLIAIAGSLLALQAQLKPELGFVLLLPIFGAAILGGTGSPQGALVGGLVVGIVSEVAVNLGFLSPGYKISVAFIILILVILIRPRGLFGVQS